MYIEKRKIGKKVKYYLTHSHRENGKVQKIRKYLGTDINQKLLKEREEKAKKLILEEIHEFDIINDPLNSKISKEEIEFVEKLEKSADLKILHLTEKQWEEFSSLFTYNTNAIEGSNLSKQEVTNVLEKDKLPNKPEEDILETYGVDEAIEFTRKTKEHVSLEFIKRLHKIVFKKTKSFAGEFRKKGQEVVIMDRLGRIKHRGAPSERVTKLLQELVLWYNKYKDKYPALILAVVVHNQFEHIHPFADGNGRVGRLLLNNILLRHNLPPVNISLSNRTEYYNTLQVYSKEKDIRPSIDLILKEYRDLKKKFKK